jgi:putative acetyltransferase
VNERLYTPADLPSIIEVYTASIRSLAVQFYSPEQISAWAPATPDVERWQKRLASLNTIVAECDGVLSGFVSYRHDGYVDFLFTHPAFARRGVATRLYLRVESVLRSEGCPRIFTHASLAARLFFEHHGFNLDAEESVECRGTFLRRFAMHKMMSTGSSGGVATGGYNLPA